LVFLIHTELRCTVNHTSENQNSSLKYIIVVNLVVWLFMQPHHQI